MLILDGRDVRAALTMEDCIEAVREALKIFARRECEQFPRFQLKPAAGGPLMGLMPAFQGGDMPVWCLKDVLVASGNRARGLDSHQGVILLHDGETGEPLALVDATAITALRTAATSAVATLALARPDARRIAILGSGTQARAHIDAMRLAVPQAEIVLWARSPGQAGRLAEATGCRLAPAIEDAVVDADIICTVTGAREPLLRREWLKAGCHINAVGASSPQARELGTDIIASAAFFVDSRAQAMVECGELLLPMHEGIIGEDHIRGEIGEVLVGSRPGRSSADALTVFKSLGMAVEDMAAAVCALRNAKTMGIGQEIRWRAG
ncbi:ornithine cyclodeaminase family protein [Chelatococcus asaccharovorans]|uniref:ornithine cyclodeaminase family protein n=1 Tax=Chelatococcus asaccharovorans TaxID=28210 RepID=UPI00224C6653|nr:ornithine cyclodeaminase family protein [Chelatococcus asaccharovorans]CAH1661013.1 Ornithine cyclodeaminase [Chelatococcus asaccharovorans]CAH1683601.1 Ornithine cyclodeaminase [Chelatococcus asaccharovorans]